MELSRMSALVIEGKSDTANALANLEELLEALTGAADACLATGMLNRAEACADQVNRTKILIKLGEAFHKGLSDLNDGISSLGDT